MADQPAKKKQRTKKDAKPSTGAGSSRAAPKPAAKRKAGKPGAKSGAAGTESGAKESVAVTSAAPVPPVPTPARVPVKEAQAPLATSESSRPSVGAQEAAVENKGIAFLRLSSECRPSAPVSPLIYLNKDVVTVGRLPTNDVAMDSKRTPQMISRQHARLVLSKPEPAQQEWMIHDCGSMNGITVNAEAVSSDGRTLRAGDVINFGRRVNPPEFEFIFEAPAMMDAPAAPAAPDEAFEEQLQRIAELEKELKAEREQNEAQAAEALKRRQATREALNVSDISSELACCICKDWLVHAATIECSHSYCWACIDRWLQTKQFVCPTCREQVTREPVRTRAVDGIVQKTVQRLSEQEKADYEERVAAAEAQESRSRKNLQDLEKSVDEAIKNGKSFFRIDMNWRKKEKDTFAKGVKEYSGSARETYCRLIGLTVQWVHSADEDKLNQSLHNLALQNQIGKPDEEIRQRLLMFLRYG
mmetsp:Transcript_59174/g.105170  ORF Transcript_59174/g.105170 Transcript_59174/m.105170 type:complete len:473 (+) Transcript_59174:55-1473(+)